MNYQFESKADGPQRTTSHTTKTFCDTLLDSLPESSKTRKPTRFRFRTLKETDSCHNPIRTRGPNPTRIRLPQSLQKENCSPQIKERGSNSQKTKNYRPNRAFRSKKTISIRKSAVTIVKFSWLFSRIPQTEKVILQHWKTWTTTNSSLNRIKLKQQQLATKILHQESQSPSI